MQRNYEQRLRLFDQDIIITYSFHETWQKRLYSQLPPPVIVRMFAGNVKDRQRLTTLFSHSADHLIFIIKEYLSTVKDRFTGISFHYELVNHAIKLKENREDIEYYRAELKWSYDRTSRVKQDK